MRGRSERRAPFILDRYRDKRVSKLPEDVPTGRPRKHVGAKAFSSTSFASALLTSVRIG